MFASIGVSVTVNGVMETVLGMVRALANIGFVVGSHVLGRMSHVGVVVAVVCNRLVEPISGLMVTVVGVSMRICRIVSILIDGVHVEVMGNSIEISSMVMNMRIDESFWNVSGRVMRIGVLREGMCVFNVGSQVGMSGQFEGRLVHIVQGVFVM